MSEYLDREPQPAPRAGLAERMAAVCARAPYSSMPSCRTGDPLASMVNAIAGHEVAGDGELSAAGLATLARFVSELLAEGEPDLGLAIAVYTDIANLFMRASEQLAQDEKAEMRPAGTYNAARLRLVILGGDYADRAMVFARAMGDQREQSVAAE